MFVRAVAIPWRCSAEPVFTQFNSVTPAPKRKGWNTGFWKSWAFNGVILALAVCGLPNSLSAQTVSGPAAGENSLPNTPAVAAPPAASGTPSSPQQPSAIVSGTVVDTNGEELTGANVTLAGPVERQAVTGSNGEFTFSDLPAGDFLLTVTGKGMKTVTIPNIALHAGEVRFFPKVVLAVADAAASVEVIANPEQLAEKQIHLEMQQRVLGIVPNFYTSYDWNAEHLWAKQKFQLALREETDPITLVDVAAVAGAEQFVNRFSGYGTGPVGYLKRFGAAYGDNAAGDFIGSAILPSLFHQDPRYFYKGTGSFGSRALYAMSFAVMCRGDNGRRELNYSHILGNFAAGAVSNLYVPERNEGATLVLTQGLIDIAADAGGDLLREFVLRGFTTHIATGKGRVP